MQPRRRQRPVGRRKAGVCVRRCREQARVPIELNEFGLQTGSSEKRSRHKTLRFDWNKLGHFNEKLKSKT